VICTTTSAREPVLPGALLEPGMHVNLVGSSAADSREADDDVVARSRFFIDFRPSTMDQAGELLHAIAAGHSNSLCPKELSEKRKWNQGKANQNTIHRDVYLHLALAGNDGLTSGEILRLLEAKRKVSRDAVRQALNRMRKAGTARRLGTLWHLV
jgi:ornithine cyclodeaminase